MYQLRHTFCRLCDTNYSDEEMDFEVNISCASENELLAPPLPDVPLEYSDLDESDHESDFTDDSIPDEENGFEPFPNVQPVNDICVRLNTLIQDGIIDKSGIFFKWINDVTLNLQNPQAHQYDEDVVHFMNTIKYLGGERTANFVRGPMYHGKGRGGLKRGQDAAMNLGGPSRTTLLKNSQGYTVHSGIVKSYLSSFLCLSVRTTLLFETPIVKVIPVACANDSTALKPGMQYDEQQHVIVGLKDVTTFNFVSANPNPEPEFLKENVVTEVNVTYVSSMDNKVSLPIGITYKQRTGKTGAALKEQFQQEISILQQYIS